MVDYLYQLDYEFKPEPRDGIIIITDAELEPGPSIEPESPVAQVIERFEDMAARQSESENDFWAPRTKHTKKKQRKAKERISSSWGYPSPPAQDDLPPPPPPPPPIYDMASCGSEGMVLNLHAQMYALADKYGIHDLKDLVREKFAEVASSYWDGSGFLMAVQTVYSSTPETDHGLRDIIVDTLSQHRELLKKVEIEALVKEVNGLAYGLLRSAWDL